MGLVVEWLVVDSTSVPSNELCLICSGIHDTYLLFIDKRLPDFGRNSVDVEQWDIVPIRQVKIGVGKQTLVLIIFS